MHEGAEVTHLQRRHRTRIGIGSQRGLDPLVDLGTDAIPDGAHRGVVAQQGGRAGGGHLGLIGDDESQAAKRLLHPVEPGVVDIGEIGHLANQVKVDLGDQMIFRREVGVGRGGGNLGAGGHAPHGQIGVGGTPQGFQGGADQFAEGLLLPRPAGRVSPVTRGRRHCIAGHMSTVITGIKITQEFREKPTSRVFLGIVSLYRRRRCG